jgi:hypothetical protein
MAQVQHDRWRSGVSMVDVRLPQIYIRRIVTNRRLDSLTVMRGLAQDYLRDADSIESVLAVNLQYSWHRNNPPIALAIHQGAFF